MTKQTGAIDCRWTERLEAGHVQWRSSYRASADLHDQCRLWRVRDGL